MQKLALVIDVVDAASEAAERDEPLDAKQEARRLVADQPRGLELARGYPPAAGAGGDAATDDDRC